MIRTPGSSIRFHSTVHLISLVRGKLQVLLSSYKLDPGNMAAQTLAAATLSPWWFMFIFFSVSFVSADTLTYDRNYLIRIEKLYGELDIVKSHRFDLPHEIALTAKRPWITSLVWRRRRRRRERRRKRGCRGGMKVRLRRAPHRPALPSLLVTNARSLGNKMDELVLAIDGENNQRQRHGYMPGSQTRLSR